MLRESCILLGIFDFYVGINPWDNSDEKQGKAIAGPRKKSWPRGSRHRTRRGDLVFQTFFTGNAGRPRVITRTLNFIELLTF